MRGRLTEGKFLRSTKPKQGSEEGQWAFRKPQGTGGRWCTANFRHPKKCGVWSSASAQPLTFDDNYVCLGTNPLDFGTLRQVVAVRVVAGPTLIRARVADCEVRDEDSTGRMLIVGGMDSDAVLPSTIPQLGVGLIRFVSFKPPLDLWDGAANCLTV